MAEISRRSVDKAGLRLRATVDLGSGAIQMPCKEQHSGKICVRLRIRCGGPAEESRQPLDGSDVLALRIGRELADAHVIEHPLAQRTDGLLAHRGLLS